MGNKKTQSYISKDLTIQYFGKEYKLISVRI